MIKKARSISEVVFALLCMAGAILLASCDTNPKIVYIDPVYVTDRAYDVRPPSLRFNGPENIREYLNEHARYISDRDNYGQVEHWAVSEEFIEKGGGDCEDYAGFVLTYLTELHIEGVICIIETDDPIILHAVLRIGETYYAGQGFRTCTNQEPVVIGEYSLDEYLSVAYNYFGSRAVLGLDPFARVVD